MRRLGRVSDALELLQRVAVQLGRLPPSPLRVGLHAEVHLRHCGRPRRSEAAEHIQRPLLEHGFLRLTDVEVSAVQGRVGACESDARPEWLGLLDHLVRRLDRVTRPALLQVDLRPPGEEVVGHVLRIRRLQCLETIESRRHVAEGIGVRAETEPGEGAASWIRAWATGSSFSSRSDSFIAASAPL